MPDPNEEPEPNPSPPEPKIGIDPNTITDSRDGYVLVGQHYSSSFSGETLSFSITGLGKVSCSPVPAIVEPPTLFNPWPLGTKLEIEAAGSETEESYPGGPTESAGAGYSFISTAYSGYYSWTIFDGGAFTIYEFGAGEFISSYQTGIFNRSLAVGNGFVCFGSMSLIAEWVQSLNQTQINGYTILKHTINQVIPLGEQKQPKPRPILQPGVPPRMKPDCCEEILDSLEDLKEVLHVDFFMKEKFPVPSYLLAPGVDTSKTTVANNYSWRG
ncbi:MAG: hypothetical protein ICV80_18650 [Microcoleus sp. T1-bin1]|nr:hypothetical protein [Microcoleus sp. T1-bin1]